MPHDRQVCTKRVKSELSPSPDLSCPKLVEIPKEVLTLILIYASQATSLLDLALVEKNFAAVALPLFRSSLDITSFSQLASVAKYKRTKKGKESEETRFLSIKLNSIYPCDLTQSSAISSLKTLLSSVTDTLTSLILELPSVAHNPLPHLFPKLSSLSQLVHLKKLDLQCEVWFHDLLSLLPSFPCLVSLSINNLRGDCNIRHPNRSLGTSLLRKISVRNSTLTGTMIRTLLSSHSELEYLEIPIPGGKQDVEGSIAWQVIENLIFPNDEKQRKGLKGLKVWDRWGEQVAAQRRKEARKRGELVKGDKGKGNSVAVKPEEEEIDELASDLELELENPSLSTKPNHPPSPFLSSLSSTSPRHNLQSLLLTTAYLPSSPDPESFESLLPHLSTISELIIEDTTTSGLRKMVENALKEGKWLKSLKELKSTGIKRKSVGVKKEKKQDEKKKNKADNDDDEQGDSDQEHKEEISKQESQGFKMSKVDLKFEKFCKSKGIDWKIV